VVERAGLDADLGGELAQAHRLIAMFEDQAQPRLADRLHGLGAVRADRARHPELHWRVLKKRTYVCLCPDIANISMSYEAMLRLYDGALESIIKKRMIV